MGREVYIVRILIVLVVFTGTFVALGRHIYHLQVVRHEELYAKARQKYVTSKTLVGQRGSIYDRRGNLLAGNIACKDIYAEPGRIKPEKRDAIIDILSSTLEVPEHVLRARFNSGLVEVVVQRGVNLNLAISLEEMELEGVRLVDSWQRTYPKGQLMANSLGFCNAESIGSYGLEQVWNDTLLPRQEQDVFVRNRRGDRLYTDMPAAPPSLDGKAIYLTIEEPIQHILETELAKLAAEFKPKYAYAVLADPHTGAVLGMAQWPSFDPNDRSQMKPELWRNHLISDVLDPGSTMKGVAITGAMDFGVVDLDTVYDCEDGFWFYAGRGLRDSGHKYGMLSVKQIVERSSNIGTAKIALDMGKARLYQTLRRFGFGERTGIGLNEESAGILRAPARWDGLSITRFPIGQGVSVTPLQMLQAYCALANKGKMMQLHLVDRILDPTTGVVEQVEPEVRRIAARSGAVEQMVSALVEVTEGEHGTAHTSRVKGYLVAGKTGTSQKLVNGSYEGHKKYISSFVGFVPAYDPAFTLIVVADEPSNGKYYGGTVTGPTWSRIAENVLQYLNIPPTPDEAAAAGAPVHVVENH